MKREFAMEGLDLNFFSVSSYLGAYLGPWDQLEAWGKSQVEAWAHGVRVLGKISRQHPPVGLRRLGNVVATQVAVPAKYCPGFGTLIGPIEEALREKFIPAIFGGG